MTEIVLPLRADVVLLELPWKEGEENKSNNDTISGTAYQHSTPSH